MSFLCVFLNVPGERNSTPTESRSTENENGEFTSSQDSNREFHEAIEEIFFVDSINPNMNASDYPDILVDAEFDEEFESDFNFSKAT